MGRPWWGQEPRRLLLPAEENQLILEQLDCDDSIRYAYYSVIDFIGVVSPIEECLILSCPCR